jgi:filamentous hemagglutinin family protein
MSTFSGEESTGALTLIFPKRWTGGASSLCFDSVTSLSLYTHRLKCWFWLAAPVIRKEFRKFWRLKLSVSVAIGGAIASFCNPIFAQVVPDGSLGIIEQSILNTGNGHLRIDGGAIRGTNLFHSFSNFSIPEGQSVYFQNPGGIQNIFSRVTGGKASDIAGTLGVVGGTANLFLLNPKGIIFGPNARLDISGSFVATTATAVQFGNQGFFSSAVSESVPLLTVNPSAFLFDQVAHAPIVNHSTAPLASGGKGLQVPDGQSLLLLGGDVILDGGRIKAAGGRVELGAVTGIGTVDLSLNDNDLHLSFPTTLDRADITLTNRAIVDTSGEGSGPVQIWGKRVSLDAVSQVNAFTWGAKSGGSLTVDASQSVELIGRGVDLLVLTFGDGKAADVTINTRRLIVRDGAEFLSGTLGQGSAGQLTFNALESVEVAAIFIPSDNNSAGGALASFTGGTGDAGNLTINTARLILRDGGVLSTESVPVAGPDGTSFASGQAGNITVNASESIELLGKKGGIFTNTVGAGNAGNVKIQTGRFLAQDGSGIATTSSKGSGNAGNITVQARSIELNNQSQINAQTVASQGGNITLQVQDYLLLRRGSLISTTAGTAQAGGDGGNITISGNFLIAVPQENSDISANAFAGSGGQITLSVGNIFSFDLRTRQDLQRLLSTTNPADLDPSLLPSNDITAFSQANPTLDRGAITVQSPGIDPTQGLTALPAALSDPSGLITAACPSGGSQQSNQFIVTGRGGLPPIPSEALNPDAIQVDLVSVNRDRRSPQALNPSSLPSSLSKSATAPIVEAQEIQTIANGIVKLVATQPSDPRRSANPSPFCYPGVTHAAKRV